MKLIYDCEQFIALGSKADFQPTFYCEHLHLLDAEHALNFTCRTYYKTFKEFYDACAEGKICNAEAYIGWFKVPKVQVHCRDNVYTITAHNFPNEICVWNRAKEVHPSLDKLMKALPADDFMEYLRERNISLNIHYEN